MTMLRYLFSIVLAVGFAGGAAVLSADAYEQSDFPENSLEAPKGVTRQVTETALQVYTQGPFLVIKNVGRQPVEIIDITVNDRDECTTLSNVSTELDKNYLHKLWVTKWEGNWKLIQVGPPISVQNMFPKMQALVIDNKLVDAATGGPVSPEPRKLNVGDVVAWGISCMQSEIVRTTIKTDVGVFTYSF
jgi:hypothetical protein